MFDRLHQDLTYGVRVLRKAPGFTVTAMLVLGLGIGIPLSAFRVVLTDLQGGSAPDPDSLVRLTRRAPGAHMTSLTYPELAFYAANAKSFQSVIGIAARNQAVFSEAAGRQHARVHPRGVCHRPGSQRTSRPGRSVSGAPTSAAARPLRYHAA